MAGVWALATSSANAERSVRLATYGADLSRDGPGLLLRDIVGGQDTQIGAVLDVIAETAPDILLLTDIDVDAGGASISALAQALERAGVPYPYHFAVPGNAGLPSGHDLDGDGRRGTPRDSQGYGRFRGDGAMALFSRWPLVLDTVQDFSGLEWPDLPDARLPVHEDQTPFPTAEALGAQRLSSVGHWIIDVQLPTGALLSILAYAATPPVFDGPEDRNGLRAADETALWKLVLDGTLGAQVQRHAAVMGRANIDPVDGDGLHSAIIDLARHPLLQDPEPESAGGRAAADAIHRGDPGLDTAEWTAPEEGGPGNLRVDYVFPSRTLQVLDAAVHWPQGAAETERRASRHRLVWVDVAMPEPAR